MELEHLGHGVGVLARLTRALGEFFKQHRDLFERGADRDDAIGKFSGLFGVDRPGGRNEDFGWGFGHCPQAGGFHPVIVAIVLGVLAGGRVFEQLLDNLDGFEHAGRALANIRPILSEEAFVECFACPDAQPVAVGVHGGQRGRRLRHHGGVPAEGGGGDAGAHIAFGAFADGGQNVPDEGRLPLLGHPGLEMIGGHGAVKALLLCIFGQLDAIARMELFEHHRIADQPLWSGLEHRHGWHSPWLCDQSITKGKRATEGILTFW